MCGGRCKLTDQSSEIGLGGNKMNGSKDNSQSKKELTPEQKEKIYQIYKTAFWMRLKRKGLLTKKPH
jgi:hypothetical protein